MTQTNKHENDEFKRMTFDNNFNLKCHECDDMRMIDALNAYNVDNMTYEMIFASCAHKRHVQYTTIDEINERLNLNATISQLKRAILIEQIANNVDDDAIETLQQIVDTCEILNDLLFDACADFEISRDNLLNEFIETYEHDFDDYNMSMMNDTFNALLNSLKNESTQSTHDFIQRIEKLIERNERRTIDYFICYDDDKRDKIDAFFADFVSLRDMILTKLNERVDVDFDAVELYEMNDKYVNYQTHSTTAQFNLTSSSLYQNRVVVESRLIENKLFVRLIVKIRNADELNDEFVDMSISKIDDVVDVVARAIDAIETINVVNVKIAVQS